MLPKVNCLPSTPPPYFTDGEFPQQRRALAQVSQPGWQVMSWESGRPGGKSTFLLSVVGVALISRGMGSLREIVLSTVPGV